METDGARAIAGLLDDLHRALLAGDLKTLEAIEARLAEVTPTATLTTADRRKLAARAEDIRPLLQASGRGLRSAKRRLAEIERVLAGQSFYDRRGRLGATMAQGQILAKRF